jgi:hypothetical protein
VHLHVEGAAAGANAKSSLESSLSLARPKFAEGWRLGNGVFCNVNTLLRKGVAANIYKAVRVLSESKFALL